MELGIHLSKPGDQLLIRQRIEFYPIPDILCHGGGTGYIQFPISGPIPPLLTTSVESTIFGLSNIEKLGDLKPP